MSLYCRLCLSIVIALSVGACSTPVQITERPDFPSHDYSSRQIVGRQTLLLDPGVRIHADRMFTSPSGAIQFKGRIFVDGRGQPADEQPWPTSIYADDALWNADRHELTLSGHLVVQRGNAAITGTQAGTKAVVDGKKLKIFGPARMDVQG